MNESTKWIFTDKDGNKSEVARELWMWRAIYKDGSSLYQYEQTVNEHNEAVFHQIGEIDMTQVVTFEMINIDNGARHSLDVSPDMTKIIHFYRHIHFNALTPRETHVKVYCFGYIVKGTSVYNFILPDDRVVVTLNRNISLIAQQ